MFQFHDASNFTVSLNALWACSPTAQVITARNDGTAIGEVVRLNGITQAQVVPATGDSGGHLQTSLIYLGSSVGNFFPILGRFAEVIIYNRALSDIETSQVETYAKSFYAIA